MSRQNVYLLVVALSAVGCGTPAPAPAVLSVEERSNAVQSLIVSGAKRTAEEESACYLSLNNTHIQVRQNAIVVEGSAKTRNDLSDFAKASAKAAEGVMPPEDLKEFQNWLHSSLTSRGQFASSGSFHTRHVSLTRVPLRINITPRQSPIE